MTLKHLNIAALVVLVAVASYLFLETVFDTPTSAVQSVWTAAGLVGTILSAWNLRDAIIDKQQLKSAGRNGELMFMANETVVQEMLRLSKMLVVFGVGLFILTSQPTLTAAQRKALHIPEWTTASVVITLGLLWIVLGTVIQSIIDRRIRQRFYQEGA